MTSAVFDPLQAPLDGWNLVEASAGTGKTHAITLLVLRLLVERGLGAEQLLVVTFTNAAAAELRTRVRQALREGVRLLEDPGAESGNDSIATLVGRWRGNSQARTRLLLALRDFDQAAICTIHSFCMRVLREHAFESGAPLDLTLRPSAAATIEEVVQDYWLRTVACDDQLARALAGSAYPIDFQVAVKLATEAVAKPSLVFLPPPDTTVADEDACRRLKFLHGLIEFARSEVASRQADRAEASYDELLQRVHRALRASGGDRLARSIRDRYRAALIDEFQDTDLVQYEIFQSIYPAGGDQTWTVYLVGDPKQAIYRFRGADIFTYRLACERVGEKRRLWLAVNWRSDPRLLEAVSRVFRLRPAPFLLDWISFEDVKPRPGAKDAVADGQAPLKILVPRPPAEQVTTQGWSKARAMRAIVSAIARYMVDFLQRPPFQEGHRIEPGDIAVLCRTNQQARATVGALRSVGLPAVLQAELTVFQTEAAVAMEQLLAGIAAPGDPRSLRGALASRLVGMAADEIAALEEEREEWEKWADRFLRAKEQWQRSGVLVALRAVAREIQIEPKLLRETDGERVVTDFWHLAELLARAEQEEQLGPEGLVDWLRWMRGDPTARRDLEREAAQVRIENDARAIQVTTLHRAKGLEYPVVFLPFAWDGPKKQNKVPTASYHDPDGRPVYHFGGHVGGGAEQQTGNARAEEAREEQSEELRLLYVGMTRARHYLCVVWGEVNQAESSPLGYLLGGEENGGGRRRESQKDKRARLLENLRRLDDGNTIAVEDLEVTAAEPAGATIQSTTEAFELSSRPCRRQVRPAWEVTSFTSMVRNAPVEEDPALAARDESGDGPGRQLEREERSASREVPLASFPAGAGPGTVLHRILERADPVGDKVQFRALVEEELGRARIAVPSPDAVTEALWSVLDQPLGDAPSLREIARDGARLPEMEFFLSAFPRQPVSPVVLSDVLRKHGFPSGSPDYHARVAALGFQELCGYLHGFIDLAFTVRGRWYVVDYKSNLLGRYPEDYREERLREAMAEHHYYLQLLLYALAVHRHLRRRMPGYDYEKHFGGGIYLFLRGMGGPEQRGGVVRERPDSSLIVELDRLFGREEDEA